MISNKKIEWVNPKEFYELECQGIVAKLDGKHISKLIAKGKEGLLKSIVNKKDAISYVWYKNKRVVIDGIHRTYSAIKLGIEKVPAQGSDGSGLSVFERSKFVSIEELEVLGSSRELDLYYENLRDGLEVKGCRDSCGLMESGKAGNVAEGFRGIAGLPRIRRSTGKRG